MIPGLLHGRLLNGAPAGGVIAAPTYQSLLAFATHTSSSAATATFSINPNGVWTSVGTGYPNKSGIWFDPETFDAGSGYEGRITPTNTSGVAGVMINEAAGWVALSLARKLQVGVQRFTTGITTSGHSVLVEIRPTGGVVVSSGTFPLTSSAEVTIGGGGGGCPAVSMWLGAGLSAGDVAVGQTIDGVASDAPELLARLLVLGCQISLQPGYRIVTSNGAACQLSDSTPFDLRDGSTRYMGQMLGEQVLRDDGFGGLVWDVVVACIPLGEIEVIKLNVGGQSLLAGENPLMRIVSHNIFKF